MPLTRTRLAIRVLALATLLGVTGCEPSGPGSLTAIVTAPNPTGGLVIEVAGAGITGFEGLGDVCTLADVAIPGASSRRVVVVSSTGSSLRFRVQVEDVSGDPPSATVVAAVDTSNRPVEAFLGYSVRIAR